MTTLLDTIYTLEQNEEIVERGVSTFREVGTALMRIRDGEQYREAGFGGFVEYLQSKPWGVSQPYAYQIIDAAAVSAMAEIPNERQARELAPLMKKAAPEIVREVYQEAVLEAGGVERVTAKQLRVKVQEVLPRANKPKGRTQRTDKKLEEVIATNKALGKVLASIAPERWSKLGYTMLKQTIQSMERTRAELDVAIENASKYRSNVD